MKLNIHVELEWIDEEGNLDEQVREQIIDGVVRKISKSDTDQIARAAKEAVEKQVSGAIDDRVREITAELLNGTFDITDKWGETKVRQTTVKAELKKEMDTFLTAKVDKEGRADNSSYSTTDTRLNWLLKRNLDDKYAELKKQVDQVGKQTADGLKVYVDGMLKAQLSEGIAKAIGLDAIINSKK